MPFVVRDLARESGKRVRLELRGQETEIDKYPDRADDGSGPAPGAQRRQPRHRDRRPSASRPGKRPEGTLTLERVHGVGDIGAARDRRRRARDRCGGGGARARERWACRCRTGSSTRPRCSSVICAPGFSTRDETDRASGRGVGMAVVQTTVRGAERPPVASRPTRGAGHAVRIELPLTLAIADALIATVGDRTFAVPQAAVREVIEVDPSALRAGRGARDRRRTAAACCRSCGSVAAVRPRARSRARAASRVRDRHRGRRRRASRSIGSSASGRSSCAAWPTRWSGSMALPARPISATAAWC